MNLLIKFNEVTYEYDIPKELDVNGLTPIEMIVKYSDKIKSTSVAWGKRVN